jgi:hypothetical protein
MPDWTPSFDDFWMLYPRRVKPTYRLSLTRHRGSMPNAGLTSFQDRSQTCQFEDRYRCSQAS